MSAVNVRFFSYGRFADNVILGAHSIEKAFEVNYRNEAANLVKKLKLLNLAPDERQKCNTQNGAWFCRADSSGLVYMALCNPNYPERHAYNLINEAQEEIEKIPNYADESEEVISKLAKRCLPSLLKKYDDLSSVDKIYSAQEKANEVKNMMGSNIRGMMDNMQNLEVLEKKSTDMQSQAQMFSSDSGKLARIMYMRALKMKIIVCILVIAVILYIVIPLVSNTSDDPPPPKQN
jgi:vesicle-associated membrane protein 7